MAIAIFIAAAASAQTPPWQQGAPGQPVPPSVEAARPAPAQGPPQPHTAPKPETGPEGKAAATGTAKTPDKDARISLHLKNANLTEVIDIIGSELHMNYVIDPSVKGIVNVNTMGELRQEDLLGLLQTILRANGAIAVQSGSFWRIVPLKDAPRVPVGVSRDATGATLPPDDRMVMNVIPLNYIAAGDMSKILGGYLTEAGQIVTYDPGNVLLITDTSRNMKRLVDLVNLFDNDALASQRVQLFAIQNLQAGEVARDLKDIFAAYAMSDKSAVKFLPIDKINSILAVSGNPQVFKQVKEWIDKLDKPVKKTGMQNFVYKVQNTSAENIAMVLSSLYGVGYGYGMGGYGGMGGAMGGYGAGGYGGGALGSFGAGGYGGYGAAGRPVAGYGAAAGGGYGAGGGMGVGAAAGTAPGAGVGGPAAGVGQAPLMTGAGGIGGGYGQGYGMAGGEIPPGGMLQSGVRIVPDVINNAIIVQSTPQDWDTIQQTIKELDIIPKQVMIEAKVYEVTLTGALAFGVEAFLQQKSAANKGLLGQFALGAGEGGFSNPGVSLSTGLLVGRTRELLTFLNAQENRTRVRAVSAPNILASDNLDAKIQVGAEVPILTSQGIAPGAQLAGSTIFANTVQGRDTGVILTVTPRINSSGLVTLRLSQEVSQAIPPATSSAIQSPSIQKRSIQTQVTVQDGETIALGGIIQENKLTSKNRVPLLGDIPYLGVLFGSTSYSTSRTELIITLTPRVIQDVGDAAEVSGDLKGGMKQLRKAFRELKTEEAPVQEPKPDQTK